VTRHDYRAIIEGTSLKTVHVEGPVTPFRSLTRMARIRALAPLSFRDWAPVSGVSHSAVKQWADGDEPDRAKLDRVLGALSEAAVHQPDLAGWLVTSLPGMQVRPLDGCARSVGGRFAAQSVPARRQPLRSRPRSLCADGGRRSHGPFPSRPPSQMTHERR
jgi:hypothetical protein